MYSNQTRVLPFGSCRNRVVADATGTATGREDPTLPRRLNYELVDILLGTCHRASCCHVGVYLEGATAVLPSYLCAPPHGARCGLLIEGVTDPDPTHFSPLERTVD
jgi:hypothetical protein